MPNELTILLPLLATTSFKRKEPSKSGENSMDFRTDQNRLGFIFKEDSVLDIYSGRFYSEV